MEYEPTDGVADLIKAGVQFRTAEMEFRMAEMDFKRWN